jgi:hypothetical protein
MRTLAAALLILSFTPTTGAQGRGSQLAGSQLAPRFRLNPVPFAVGASVSAHVEITDGSFAGPARITCIDPTKPDPLITIDTAPAFKLILVQLRDDGTTADLETAPLFTAIPYAPGGTTDWKSYELPPLSTPATLNVPKLQAVWAYVRTLPGKGGDACAPKTEIQVIRTHNFKRVCRLKGTRCEYVLTAGYNG